MALTYFPSAISEADKLKLEQTAVVCRGEILTMTTLAASGHPGGSMSSIDLLLAIYEYANISPDNMDSASRDKVLVSIGHISPAVYSCLAARGFFLADTAVATFRLAGSQFEGHIERSIPGVEWTTGNLGQGLSAACGMALAAKIKKEDSFVYVLMGDGEQQKGQISEACRFAAKYKLDNLIAIVDMNGLQISGKTEAVMPQDLEAEYKAHGWDVIHTDGHDFQQIASAFLKAQKSDKPAVILAKTIMGKGVPFMEHQYKWHGAPLTPDEYTKAMEALLLEPQLERYKSLRNAAKGRTTSISEDFSYPINTGKAERKLYVADASTDCRSAFGHAVTQLVAASMESGTTPAVIFDCDLAGSLKTTDVEKLYPSRFVQCGISEHHAASMAGGASGVGVNAFFTSFTMFAIDEVYNQLRMNDVNNSNLKVVSTHAGVDVGEDGRTHQCIDYLGLMRNAYGFKVLAPADPNQTDALVHYAANNYGNFHIVMGRSKVPVITNEQGQPFYNTSYSFEYGHLDKIRNGKYPLIAFGGMLHRALKVKDIVGEQLAVYNAPTPVCIKEDEIETIAKAGKIFVLEDHNPESGLYATICNIVARKGLACKVIPFGVPRYALSGVPDEVFKLIGIDVDSVAAAIKAEI